MLERFVDKQLRVLTHICNVDNTSIDVNEVNLDSNELQKILGEYANKNWLKIEQIGYIPYCDSSGEEVPNTEDIYIIYSILNKVALNTLFRELKGIYHRKEKPIIKLKALELIARKIGDLNTGYELEKFLINNGIDRELVIYPNTKWKMIYDIFEYFAFSGNKADIGLLFKLIEEFSHPLMFDGDKEKAIEVQDYFTNCLEYDGYCVYKGKVSKLSDEITKEIEDRQRQRKSRELLDTVDNKLKSMISDFTVSPTQETIQKPIPIQIVDGQIRGKMEIDGLEKGLEEIAKGKKDDKTRFPHKLPAGTRWENITIKFLDNENVYIQVKQFNHNTNFKEMGFIGKGNNPNPSEAWEFLKILAKLNGELNIKDREARDKYKKQKEFLTNGLQSYFSLDYDPFYPYISSLEKNGNSYKIKLALIPPPNNEITDDKDDEEDKLGIKEYLNEQTPQVYEE